MVEVVLELRQLALQSALGRLRRRPHLQGGRGREVSKVME
jgi:hypothetical protein